MVVKRAAVLVSAVWRKRKLKAELEQLIALQNTDTNIRRLEAAIAAAPQKRAALEQEFERRASEFRALETRRDEARSERARLEREISETRAHAERAERNLMASKNAKDYEAAIRELDAARKHISQLETSTLEKMETLDSAEKELGEREPEINKLRAELAEQLKAFDEEERAMKDHLAAARRDREQLASALPKATAVLYNRISAKIKGGVAVAEVRNNSCSACQMGIRPQVMAEIRRGEEIILCENCSRILYANPTAQPAKTS